MSITAEGSQLPAALIARVKLAKYIWTTIREACFELPVSKFKEYHWPLEPEYPVYLIEMDAVAYDDAISRILPPPQRVPDSLSDADKAAILQWMECEASLIIMYEISTSLIKDYIKTEETSWVRTMVRPLRVQIDQAPSDNELIPAVSHAIMRVKLINDEWWVLDFTGEQFGFKEVFVCLRQYWEERMDLPANIGNGLCKAVKEGDPELDRLILRLNKLPPEEAERIVKETSERDCKTSLNYFIIKDAVKSCVDSWVEQNPPEQADETSLEGLRADIRAVIDEIRPDVGQT